MAHQNNNNNSALVGAVIQNAAEVAAKAAMEAAEQELMRANLALINKRAEVRHQANLQKILSPEERKWAAESARRADWERKLSQSQRRALSGMTSESRRSTLDRWYAASKRTSQELDGARRRRERQGLPAY